MAWDYIRIDEEKLPYLSPKPVGDNDYEFVLLPGWPYLNATNSDDPPGSIHTSDVFTPHPTIPRAWKFVYRLDDRVTLATGEKVLPIPFEGRLRQENLVKEAVVFGLNRVVPGLLLFKSGAAHDMDDTSFLDAVWPAVQDANSQAESFGRIMRNMVVPIPATTSYPVADKGSIMCSRLYRASEAEIDAAYRHLESPTPVLKTTFVLGPDPSREELQIWFLQQCHELLGLQLIDENDDLYEAGCDSLRATQLSSLVRSILPPESASQVSLNTIYAAGTVKRLVTVIVSMMAGKHTLDAQYHIDQIEVMQSMIAKYSKFEQPSLATDVKESSKVVVSNVF
jgi:aryl carrier-like protein